MSHLATRIAKVFDRVLWQFPQPLLLAERGRHVRAFHRENVGAWLYNL